jgi:DtxR family Mn-dependent transcriptional regulator
VSSPLINLLGGLAVLGALWVLFRPNTGVVPALRRARRLAGRVLMEDALKHVLKEHDRGGSATVQSLAGALQISTDDAAELAARVEARGLLRSSADGFHPTPAGRDYALHVIRAHRLWERYLADQTGLHELEWHGSAERQEHALTPDQADALAARLGHPRFDPHGDPIPTASGEMKVPAAIPLAGAAVDRPYRIVHIEDEPETVYAQLVAEGLHAGMELRVVDSTPERVRFWADGDEHVLAPVLASNVSVAPAPDETLVEGDRPSERLSSLEAGASAEILFISRACRGLERRRLMDLGIVPGTRIEAVMTSPTGDPMAYRVRGTIIAIRDAQAGHIHVRRDAKEAAV